MVDEPKELTKADVLAAVALKGDPSKADPALTARSRANFIAGARAAHLMRYPNTATPGVPSVPFDEAAVGAVFDGQMSGRTVVPTNSVPNLTAEQAERMRAALLKHGSDAVKAKLGQSSGSAGAPPVRSEEDVQKGIAAAAAKKVADEAAAKETASADAAKKAADEKTRASATLLVAKLEADLAAAKAALEPAP